MARRRHSSRTVNWAFVRHAESGDWTWREMSIDGSIARISSPLWDFGATISDAITHGFRPKEDHWVVTNRTGTTHFDPGSTPIAIPPDHQVVKPPNERRRVSASPAFAVPPKRDS